MKKKTTTSPRFALARRGYDVQAVEDYIAAARDKAEKTGIEQKERIRILSAQCDRLEREIAVYRDKEEQIKNALISAGEQAEKTVLDIKFRYAMELERLKLFRAKWTGAYEEIKERYAFGKDALNMESVAVSVRLELEKFLAQDFSLDKGGERDERESEFKAEAERLSQDDGRVEELKEKLIAAAKRKEREQKLNAESAVGGSGGKTASKREDDTADELIRMLGRVSEGKDAARADMGGITPSESRDADARKASADCTPAAAFSLEEARHPTESLAEICAYLGLGK